MKRSGYTKTMNEYAALLPFYATIPKAVLAAIAVSALTSGGSYLDDASQLVAREWGILHHGGIVQQRPSPKARAAALVESAP